MCAQFSFGFSDQPVTIALSQLNRHGIIAGATGTGKTITLKVIAEQLSLAGIPVFLSDVKGDLMSLAEENTSDQLTERLQATQYLDYEPQSFPVTIWDALSKEGIPLRMTVSEMGPILLARLLGLNDTQSGILNIAFNVADSEGLLLIDLMDLRAMLNYIGEHAKELNGHYGNISQASIGVILRSLLVLESQGGDIFFGEPSLELTDLFTTDEQGRGTVNILNAKLLHQQPVLYSTVMLAILSELYETLPEVGDLDQPKLVFFFDEAHTLFKDTPKALVDKIELVVRLIRSKGIAIFFVTQNPTDLPDIISSQLGNRIQHGLRAYTPKEIRTVKSVADTFRQEENTDLARAIQDLSVGSAIVSTLDSDGIPTFAQEAIIYPPMSKIGTIDPTILLRVLNHSQLNDKYAEPINRESAHEILQSMINDVEADLLDSAEKEPSESIPEPVPQQQDSLFDTIRKSVSSSQESARTRKTDTPMDRFTKNMMSTVGREVGRVLTRGITGSSNNFYRYKKRTMIIKRSMHVRD